MKYPTVKFGDRSYVLSPNGTYYDAGTEAEVVTVLEQARQSGRRVRLFWGDKKSGREWGGEYAVLGRIGRSWGPVKTPILLHNWRSIGDGAILTAHILRIVDAATKRDLYRHPNYKPATYRLGPAISLGYVEAAYRTDVADELTAQFRKAGQAARWVAYMTGARMAK